MRGTRQGQGAYRRRGRTDEFERAQDEDEFESTAGCERLEIEALDDVDPFLKKEVSVGWEEKSAGIRREALEGQRVRTDCQGTTSA